MAILTIGNKSVTVDDSFRSLSPADQQKTVDEIARSIGIGGPAQQYPTNAQGQIDTGNPMMQGAPSAPDPNAPPIADQLSAGFTAGVNAIPIAGPTVLGVLERLKGVVQGRPYSDVAATDQAQVQQNPVAAGIGTVAGTVLPFMAGGALGAGRLLGMSGSLPARLGFGALSGSLINAADTGVRGGSAGDIGTSALIGGGLGGALPLAERGIGSLTSRLLGRPGVPRSVAQVARAVQREGLDVPAIQQQLATLGPDGMLADLGPNLTRQASTIASLPGEGQAIVRNRLSTRAGGANQRIRDTLDNTLGPSPIPSLEHASITAAQDALSPAYEQALQRARPVQVAPIVQNITGNIAVMRGEPQQYLQRLLPMFNTHGTTNQTANARVLFEIRKAIDGMFEGDLTKTTRGVLTNVRQRVDAELARTVPGIKAVDAQFEDLARQNAALDRGGQVLSSGPEAPWPQDLAVEHGLATPGVQMRLTQGGRALLERIVGNNANDVQALNRLIKGEGDWNQSRLRTLFGQARADRIMQVVQNEAQFARTNAVVQQGPETAARLHGGKELGEVNVEIPKNATMSGLGLNFVTKGINATLNAGREHVNAQIAHLLTTPGLAPEVATALRRALRPPRNGVLAPAVPALLAKPHPLQITIHGGR